MKRKLWNKDFLLMVQGNVVSAIGDILYSVAIGYWVYDQTGSSALMGIMSSISMFMVMFLSPFTGSIVDKSNRKVLIVGMDVLRGILMLFVGGLAFAENLSVSVVLIAAFMASLCSVFFSPSVSTLMLDIIPHDDMVRGQSVHNGAVSFVNLVGKAVSGALVAFLGVPLIIVINGVSYLISAFTELFISVPKTAQQGESVTVKGILKDFKTAAGEILHNPFLRIFIPSAVVLNLLGAGPMALMLPFTVEKGFSVEMYGYLMSIETMASLICVLLLGIVKLSPKVRYAGMTVGFISSTVFLVAAYAGGSFILVAVMLFLGCFANALGNAVFNASLMLAMPQRNRGAILGLVNSLATGGCALSAVIFGFLCDVFPIAVVFAVGSLLSIGPMAWLCLHPRTREFVTKN